MAANYRIMMRTLPYDVEGEPTQMVSKAWMVLAGPAQSTEQRGRAKLVQLFGNLWTQSFKQFSFATYELPITPDADIEVFVEPMEAPTEE